MNLVSPSYSLSHTQALFWLCSGTITSWSLSSDFHCLVSFWFSINVWLTCRHCNDGMCQYLFIYLFKDFFFLVFFPLSQIDIGAWLLMYNKLCSQGLHAVLSSCVSMIMYVSYILAVTDMFSAVFCVVCHSGMECGCRNMCSSAACRRWGSHKSVMVARWQPTVGSYSICSIQVCTCIKIITEIC